MTKEPALVIVEEMLAAIERTIADGRSPKERDRLPEKLQLEIQRQKKLLAIAQEILSVTDLQEVFNRLVEAAVYLCGADSGSVFLAGERVDNLRLCSIFSQEHQRAYATNYTVQDKLAQHAFESGEPLLLLGQEAVAVRSPAPALVQAPLEVHGNVIGVLRVVRQAQGSAFSPQDIRTLSILVRYATMVIERMEAGGSLTQEAFLGHPESMAESSRLLKQVEAERRKLEAVMRGTAQPVIVTDAEGIVLLMNDAAREAFSRHQPGTGMLLPHVVQDPSLRTLFHQAQASGRIQRGEIYLQDSRTFSATVTPIPGVGFVAMMQDITQLKQLAQLKSEFVSTVSHDLRSPLGTVLCLLDMLGEVSPLNEQQQDFVNSAEQEVLRLIELTAELLDLGHLETGMEMEMQACDMRGIMVKAIENWQPQIEEQGHALQLDLPADRLFVHGNAKRLRQVVDNLVSNAIKYTPRGGRISMHLTQEDEEIILRVQDTGIGISPQDQPYIFDHFFRVHNEQTRGVEGTGLGLAIVKSIVERHNGHIWVESAIGRGSTFSVALPAGVASSPKITPEMADRHPLPPPELRLSYP